MPRKKITTTQFENDDELYDRVFLDMKERAQKIYDKLALDYDLTDLNENDRMSINDYCVIMVRIEDLEKEVTIIMATEDSDEKWYKVERINKVLSSLRESASKYQVDLSITRRARRGDNESSVVGTIEDMKQRAKKMMEERLSYIYCPKCHELLANSWFLYPDVIGGNSITLTCGRSTDKGKICGHRFTVTSKELLDNGNRNLKDVLPT